MDYVSFISRYVTLGNLENSIIFVNRRNTDIYAKVITSGR